MLLQKDFKQINKNDLKNLCTFYKLKGLSKLSKQELFTYLNKAIATKIIQKRYRTHFYKNAEDCISLEPVSYPCFVYRSKSSKLFFYSFDNIIKNIMKTGITRDPMTREQYSDETLKKLDNAAKFYFPKKNYKSTLRIKKNPEYAKRILNRENAILSFQTRLDELKTNLLFVSDADILLWDIDEPLIIENIQYSTVHDYISGLLYEFKVVLLNIKNYDQDYAKVYKETLLDQLENLNQTCATIKRYLISF
jgi:hypothetical protein